MRGFLLTYVGAIEGSAADSRLERSRKSPSLWLRTTITLEAAILDRVTDAARSKREMKSEIKFVSADVL
ncbi:hypothetical protein GN244_ATG16336 [Phytophthora infestans]|uniref:Uncharacterized protein n=1 Tax=Phytophthora infestans TaxID=4787 RepID=A0A833WML0_PHYIN|nr:hypothetical protein GN244_ATG16336 [Phytophthora infestans]